MTVTLYAYDPMAKDPSTNSVDYPIRVYPDTPISTQGTGITDITNGIPIMVPICPGEYAPATFIVSTDSAITGLLPQASSLSDGKGHSIDFSEIDLRIVKCWYQRGDNYYSGSNSNMKKLLPELLLKDDDFMHVTIGSKALGYNHENWNQNGVEGGKNYLRHYVSGSPVYWDCSDMNYTGSGECGYEGEQWDVRDASTLQPTSLHVNDPDDYDINKQYWVTIHIPNTTVSGTYVGTISINSDQGTLGTVSLVIEVLPFTLPEPENKTGMPMWYALFYSAMIASATYYSCAGRLWTLGGRFKNAAQILGDLTSLAKHGLDAPCCQHTVYSGTEEDTHFTQYLQMRQDVGMPNNRLMAFIFDSYQTCSWGCHWKTQANCTSPCVWNSATGKCEGGGNLNTLQSVMDHIRDLATPFGYPSSELYFYGHDEKEILADGHYDLANPSATQLGRVIEAGYKCMNAGGWDGTYPYAKMKNYGSFLDAGLIAYELHENYPPVYHQYGNLIGSYGNPQTGEEKPVKYRTRYGLMLWQYNYDIAMTYAYQANPGGGGMYYNDWQDKYSSHYKSESMAYPTAVSPDGICRPIETIQYEGYREARNDVRFVTKLMHTIAEAQALGVDTTIEQNYVTTLSSPSTTNLESVDLTDVRETIIAHTMNLLSQMNLCPEGVDDCLTFTVTVAGQTPVGNIIPSSVAYTVTGTGPYNVEITYEIENTGGSGNLWTGLFDTTNPDPINPVPVQDQMQIISVGSTPYPITLNITLAYNATYYLLVGHIT